MSESIIEEDEGKHDQVLDVQRLIEAVRGSRAARILFEYRSELGSFKAVGPEPQHSERLRSESLDND